MKNNLTKIGVYGSLLSGLGNHGVIGRHVTAGNATLVGEDSITGFTLHPVAGVSFPGIKRGSTSDVVDVEVYLVNDMALANVRALEGYNPSRTPTFYDEVKAQSSNNGEIDVYLYVRSTSTPAIPSGSWRNYLQNND